MFGARNIDTLPSRSDSITATVDMYEFWVSEIRFAFKWMRYQLFAVETAARFEIDSRCLNPGRGEEYKEKNTGCAALYLQTFLLFTALAK
jgi:hypothetical protein